MNLQEDIQRIKQVMNINESSSEKLIKYVYDNGAISTAKLVGGYDNLLKLLGNYTIPKETLIKDIEWFLDEKLDDNDANRDDTGHGDFSFSEFGLPEIFYKEVNDDYHEIVFLGVKNVGIDVYHGFDLQTKQDEYLVPYNELPYKSLIDIVEMISEFLEIY